MKILLKSITVVLLSCLAAIGGDILAIQDGKLITIQAIVDPKVNIVGIGPNLIVGKMAIASASLNQDQAAAFVKASKYVWRVEINGEEQVFIEGINNKIGFVAEAGRLVVTCSGTVTYVVADKTVEKETKATATIDLGKPPTPPTPTPDPKPPTPDPSIPEGYLGYTKHSYNSFFPLKIETTKKSQIAKDTADIYRGIASKVGAGGYKESDGFKWVEAITGDMKKLLTEAIEKNGLVKSNVLPFASAVGDKLYKDFMDNKLRNFGEWQEALNAIADGLDYVK